MTGKRYSDAPADYDFVMLLKYLVTAVDEAAAKICHDLRIPVPVKLRTIAPTGTVSKMPGVSEGIHPIFSKYFLRRVRFNNLSDRETLERLVDEGHKTEPDLFAPNTTVVEFPTKDSLVQAVEDLGFDPDEVVESAADLTLEQLIAFQALYQRYWADNAVSFTANVDPDRYTAEDVAAVLLKFAGKIKGSTIFPEQSFPQAPYERISKEQYEAATTHEVGDGVDEACANGACPVR